MQQTGKKPKLVFFPHRAFTAACAGASTDDFAVYATYRMAHGRFIGTLKVVRRTDSRLLFPYDGAPTIGPYDTKEAAILAAAMLGAKLVEADLENPEL
ncbi:MAG TPA: DUF6723 family protein [Caballeronia sp.]|jgi:hypothetical protein|nr:DUF6723 family protein [Caballeronia sp.]